MGLCQGKEMDKVQASREDPLRDLPAEPFRAALPQGMQDELERVFLHAQVP
mgnify:CR=1 FL=1